MRRYYIAALGAVALPATAYGQAVGTGGVDGILVRFRDVSALWNAPLQSLAWGTFGILSVISLAITGMMQLQRGDFDMATCFMKS
jgi:hypothetical protein